MSSNQLYYAKLPVDISERYCLLLDPMLGSATRPDGQPSHPALGPFPRPALGLLAARFRALLAARFRALLSARFRALPLPRASHFVALGF